MLYHIFELIFGDRKRRYDSNLNQEKLRMKKEFEVLYVIPEVPIPVEKQLKFHAEILELYFQLGKPAPEIAFKKDKYMRKVGGFMGSIMFFMLLAIIIYVSIKDFDEMPEVYWFFAFVMIMTIIIVLKARSYLEKKFDLRVLENHGKQ